MNKKLSPSKRTEKKKQSKSVTKSKKNAVASLKQLLYTAICDFQSGITLWEEYVLLSILIYTFILFVAADVLIKQQIMSQTTNPDPFPQFTFSSYPITDDRYTPSVSALAAVVMDTSSDVFLYQKNANFRFSPASTTKIMSSLVAFDYYHAADTLTVKRKINTEGSGLGLQVGEQMTFKNLLYAMFLPSANDAAVAVADNYPGGEQQFVAAMNMKAQNLHLYDTHFGDPDGLDDNNDYTSAGNLAHLASIAIKNPFFDQIVSTKEKTISSIDGKFVYPISNKNKLLTYPGVTGIKTGTTEDAGEVLVTSAVYNNHTYIIVVMKSSDRFTDTAKLLQYIRYHVIYLSIHPE